MVLAKQKQALQTPRTPAGMQGQTFLFVSPSQPMHSLLGSSHRLPPPGSHLDSCLAFESLQFSGQRAAADVVVVSAPTPFLPANHPHPSICQSSINLPISSLLINQ